MGLFSKNPKEEPIFKTNYLGSNIKVYRDRVEYSQGIGVGGISIPISQVASVELGFLGFMCVYVETTGGKKYMMATFKKKEVRDAIHKAQALYNNKNFSNDNDTNNNNLEESNSIGIADELIKLNELKEKGIITELEFEAQKKKLLR
jgi:hypothetical protein